MFKTNNAIEKIMGKPVSKTIVRDKISANKRQKWIVYFKSGHMTELEAPTKKDAIKKANKQLGPVLDIYPK